MKGFSTREVSEALGFPASTLLAWARGGLITPLRGPRGAYVFSFQDLALLRAARELLDAELPARRVREALERLRAQMPAGRPLSAVRLEAGAGQVLVRDRDTLWEPATGQLSMDLEAPPLRPGPIADDRSEGVIEYRIRGAGPTPQRPMVTEDDGAEVWFDRAVELEGPAPDDAADAYRRALELDPALGDAHLNLGRLLHERGDVCGAAEHYRSALEADPASARAHYNLGVALEDLGRADDAAVAYRSAIAHDDELAVAHFNLSRLCEASGASAEALGHLSAYKRLLERGGG